MLDMQSGGRLHDAGHVVRRDDCRMLDMSGGTDDCKMLDMSSGGTDDCRMLDMLSGWTTAGC